jgi:tRNA-Thr(GGU) m(6)t(6)A37 methyltransferase TsaA
MTRPPRTDPTLLEWAALGLLCEAPSHGWAVAEAFRADEEIGSVLTTTRPLVYRALAHLRELGLVEVKGTAPGGAGPARTTLGATRRGRAAFARWRAAPVDHVRDLRTALMLKLVFHHRAGHDPGELLARQELLLARAERGLERRAVEVEAEPARTLALWRLSTARAARSFVEAVLGRREGEQVVYRAIGRVVSGHASLDGMPLQPQADASGPSTIEIEEPHRGSLADLDGFSHVWILSHLHESDGWGEKVSPFLDEIPRGTFASRSPHRPNPIGLSLAEIVEVRAGSVVVAGVDLLEGTPVLDLKPYVPLFDTPSGEVRSGWFETRATRIFERTSDTRFRPRSRRDS